MRGVYPVAAVRAAESALMAHLPEGALMQRAATALAVECARVLAHGGGDAARGPRRVYGASVALLVGSGANGGDALYAGAWLARRGARVRAILLHPGLAHPRGLAALRRAGGVAAPPDAGTDTALIRGADLVVDGIVGIGGHGDLQGEAVDLAAVARSVSTVAVDVPSGVHADTGDAGEHAVHADVTVTFGALKPGLVSGVGADLVGELRLVDIGLGPHLPGPAAHVLEQPDVAAAVAPPGSTDDKYTRGVVGIVAGSHQYPGAGVLATGAAAHGGAGMVRYLGRAPDEIRARYPEVVAHPDARPHEVQVQAWVVGPGLGTDDAAMELLTNVLRTDLPVIVDADAITLVARAPGLVRGRTAPTVLTPHDREFARIAEGPSADRIRSARHAAADLGATMLLKGNATVVADRSGDVYVNPTGTPWLATAGSGDVLSGLIGSLLAGGLPPARAAAVAAYVHGVAGQLAATEGPPTATDVLNALRPALRQISTG